MIRRPHSIVVNAECYDA